MFRVRSLLVAVVAAMALGTLGVGTAYATDDNNDNGGADSGIQAGVGAEVKVDPKVEVDARLGVTAVAPTTDPVPCTIDRNPRVPGCQNTGPIYGGPIHHGGPWNDRWDGGNRYIVLDGGPRLDLCSYRDYNDLLGRNTVYRDRFGRMFGADPVRRFGDYRRSCGNTTVVVNNGDCNSVTTYYTNYRNSVNRWNDLTRRYNNPGLFNSHRGEFDTIYRDRQRWQGLFDQHRRSITTVCSAPQTLNTIVVQAPPVVYTAPAPVVAPAATESTPAPVVDSAPVQNPQVYTVPKGSADTGDGSTDIG